jgi:uncharacterized protein (TIGR01319 family)
MTWSPTSTEPSVAERHVICVDFGSTFTKAALVELDEGRLLATASHPTTIDTDILDGWLACRDVLVETEAAAADAQVLACSSAGGGLRIAVVGNERLVTAEAGRRVALSSGGRVVHVSAGALDDDKLTALTEDRPDVVLLVGGTDGGNSEVLVACAERLAAARWPVVVAGNIDAQEEVAALLDGGGTPYVLADNVVPQIGVLQPSSARRAIREMFLRHVIGGKHLSARAEFVEMVHGATPDVVLAAVELLARGVPEVGLPGAGDTVVVDVGGATTDVYSVIEPVGDEADDRGLSHDVVAGSPVSRTVEGDLGVRWSAGSTVGAAHDAGFLSADELPAARTGAELRQADPGFLPTDPAAAELDGRLVSCAVGVALRRHAGRARGEHAGTDLREVALLVGSGGALRHATDGGARLTTHVSTTGGWQVPEHPRVVVDADYVLAAAGLLAERHPVAARRLLRVLG